MDKKNFFLYIWAIFSKLHSTDAVTAVQVLNCTLLAGDILTSEPFTAAVPFWGQTTYNLSGLSHERDCRTKRVNKSSEYHQLSQKANAGIFLQLTRSRQGQIT